MTRGDVFWRYAGPAYREQVFGAERRKPVSAELPDWLTEEGGKRLRGADLADAPTDNLRAEQFRVNAELGRLLPFRRRIFIAPDVFGPNGIDAVEWLKDRARRISHELKRRAA